MNRTFVLILFVISTSVQSNELSFAQALNYALQHEPFLAASEQKQQAVMAQRIAAGSLPDPILSVNLMNLPTDNFSFTQHDMTQLQFGVKQSFSRGDSLAIKQRTLAYNAQQFKWQRAERKAQIKAIISEAWLNVYRAQRSINLINRDKALFTQLIDITQVNYGSALSSTRQQDIIQAQLELTRLEDKLVQLEQQLAIAKSRLAQWLPMTMLQQPFRQQFISIAALVDFEQLEFEPLLSLLMRHPSIVALEQSVKATVSDVELAKQSYKPQLTVNAQYGYRSDNRSGETRSDFMSIGVSVDLPLFTDNRQDQWVKAAIANAEAQKTEQRVALQALKGRYFTEYNQLVSIKKRGALYQNTLLLQMAEQAEATLNAYTRDDGPFADVMRARISELDAKLAALNIEVDEAIVLARLNYYAAGVDRQVINEFMETNHEG